MNTVANPSDVSVEKGDVSVYEYYISYMRNDLRWKTGRQAASLIHKIKVYKVKKIYKVKSYIYKIGLNGTEWEKWNK